MNAKVRSLVGWVKDGFAIAAIDERPQGGLRIALRRGGEARALAFAHFEVPAILQECRNIGVAK